MVLIAGPRQCGKTTLAESVLEQIPGYYYNWDNDLLRKKIQTSELDESSKLWVFDELHKYRQWRNWLKGIFDVHRRTHQILVTGSAKLDIYRKGADSLQGRYFFHRLHPFTLSEYLGIPTPNSYLQLADLSVAAPSTATAALDSLMKLGGFPEPFLGASEKKAAR